jgi:thymidine phosphorylase
MSEPLGQYVGNALEVFECIKILRGEAEDVMRPSLELSVELTAHMLVQCKISNSLDSAKFKIKTVLDSGKALDAFRKNIELQGGNAKVCDKPELLLTKGLVKVPIQATLSGYISEIDTLAVGNAVSAIGGGRVKAEDSVDHAVGYSCTRKIGDRVEKGDEMGIVYCRRQNEGEVISENLLNAYKISREIPKTTKLIRAVV